MDEKEKKIISPIINDLNKLIELLLSYLNFFSEDSGKIKFSKFLIRHKSLLISDEEEEETLNNADIDKKVKNYFDEFNNEMISFNEHLKELNKYYENNSESLVFNKNNNDLNNLYNELKNLRVKSIFFRSRIQNNEFIYLIFKHMVAINECSTVEELLKSDLKSSYILKAKNKYLFQNNHIDIKEEIKNYIKNTLRCNIEFNYDSKGNITIKYFPFIIIIINSPLKDEIYSLKRQITMVINFINQKKENQDLLLLDKIKSLFENRIEFILNLFFDEKRANAQKIITFTPQNILDFIKNFLNYLYNYNNLMKKKCAICNRISKYSFVEKCFFPPYYKLFKIYKIPNDINYEFNEKENLFYHEDCFTRISDPSV